jgi:hypothetical protein
MIFEGWESLLHSTHVYLFIAWTIGQWFPCMYGRVTVVIRLPILHFHTEWPLFLCFFRSILSFPFGGCLSRILISIAISPLFGTLLLFNYGFDLSADWFKLLNGAACLALLDLQLCLKTRAHVHYTINAKPANCRGIGMRTRCASSTRHTISSLCWSHISGGVVSLE